MWLKILFTLAACCVTLAPAAAGDIDRITPLLLGPHSKLELQIKHTLIYGRVTAVQRPKTVFDEVGTATIKVLRVCWGTLPADTKVVTDYYTTRKQGSYNDHSPTRTPYEVDEEGYWTVWQPSDDGVAPEDRKAERPIWVYLRIRKDHEERYDQYLEQIKFLERAHPLKNDERLAMSLREFGNRTPEVAAAAVTLAVHCDADKARTEFFRRFEMKEISLPAQIHFDRVFEVRSRVERSRGEWWSAPDRLKLIASWPDQATNAELGELLMRDLSYRCQHSHPEAQDIPSTSAIAGLGALARNLKAPEEIRVKAVQSLASRGSVTGDVDSVFAELYRILELDLEVEVRRAAARGLSSLIVPKPAVGRMATYLGTSQVDKLIAFQKKEMDKQVQKHVLDAIDKAAEAILNRMEK